MRACAVLILGLFLGSAHAQDPPALVKKEPAGIRVIVLHEDELLGSESRTLATVQKQLSGKGPQPIQFSDASPAEKAVAAAWLSGQTPASAPARPSEWQGVGAVVVLQVLPPQGKKPKRTSGGLGGRLVFRSPDPAPLYVERVEGKTGAALNVESLGRWLAGALRLATGKEGP